MPTTDWRTYRLEEIAQIKGGGTPRRAETSFFGGDIPWVTPTDLSRIGVVHELDGTKETITASGLSKSSAKLIDPGSVLFSSRATIGKIAVTKKACATNQGFANFTPYRNKIDLWFLAFLLCRFTPEIRKLAGKTTFLEVPRGRLKGFSVEIPPIEEQRRIVARIKECMERVEEIEGLRAEGDAEINALILSILHQEWRSEGMASASKQALGDLGEITTGNTPSRKIPEFFGGHQPWVTPGDFNGRLIIRGREFLSERGISEGKARVVPAGSVLVVCIGATIGKLALAACDLGINQQINSVFFNPIKILPDFGYWACRALVPDILNNASKNTLPIINKGRFSKLQIPVPNLVVQEKIASRLNTAEAAISEMRREYIEAASPSTALREAILRKAFAGEL